MSTLQTEVDTLRKQLAEKEAIIIQQQREAKERDERSWYFNINILKELFERKYHNAQKKINPVLERKEQMLLEIQRNAPRLIHAQGVIEQRMIEINREINCYKQSYQLEMSIFNCIQRLDERLTKLET